MDDLVGMPDVDPEKKVEKTIDGCKVRLFFCISNNDEVERTVLCNLVTVFDKKMQRLSNVQI